jgi:flagellar protein FlaG
MGISISGVGSSISFAPAMDLPKTQVKAAQQQAVVEQFAASLPGNGGQPEYTAQELKQAAADIEHISQTFNKKLQFVVDHQSHEVIVKVIDKTTDKVIKVLPPEELQRLHRKLKETIGFLYNERV